MLTVRLRRFVSAHQHQALPLLILVWAGALSLHFTVRACQGLSPTDSALEVAALGMLCEVAKLYFGPRALLGSLRASRPWARGGHLALSALVLALMAGSVGASYLFTTRAEDDTFGAIEAMRAQALAESDEHKALSVDIATYDTRIAGMLEASRVLRAADRHTKANEQDKRVAEVQAQKDAAVLRRAGLRSAVLPAAAASISTRWVHLAVAVALELIGIAASVLLHVAWTPARGTVPTARNAGSGGGTVIPIHVTQRSVPGGARGAGSADIDKRFTARYIEARRLVASGAVRPTLDALGRAVRVSQRPAKRFLEALRGEGIVEWDGRHYRRCLGVEVGLLRG